MDQRREPEYARLGGDRREQSPCTWLACRLGVQISNAIGSRRGESSRVGRSPSRPQLTSHLAHSFKHPLQSRQHCTESTPEPPRGPNPGEKGGGGGACVSFSAGCRGDCPIYPYCSLHPLFGRSLSARLRSMHLWLGHSYATGTTMPPPRRVKYATLQLNNTMAPRPRVCRRRRCVICNSEESNCTAVGYTRHDGAEQGSKPFGSVSVCRSYSM